MQIDEVTCNVLIGEEETPWPDRENSIKSVIIHCRYIYAVAMATITLEDASNSVGKVYDITEGQVITLVWGNGEIVRNRFRVASLQRTVENNTNMFKIICYEDKIKWFVDGTNKAYKGTSYDAIKQIAEDCGLIFDGDKTNDSQVWRGNSDRTFVAARKFAQRGFASDTSLMAVAYMMPNVLRYKDINAIDIDNPLAVMRAGVGNANSVEYNGKSVTQYPVIDFKLLDRAGVFNLKSGYKVVHDDQGIENSDSRQNVENISVRNRSGNVSHRDDIANQVSTPKEDVGEIRTDESHQSSNKAAYQNQRGIQTFSNSGIAVLTTAMTNLAIFDPILVKVSLTIAGATETTENNNEMNDGPYIVMSRIIRIAGNSYSEKIIAYREGTIQQ